MDFITNIYSLILNFIRTLLATFGVNTDEVDKLLGALDKDDAEGDETTTTVA